MQKDSFNYGVECFHEYIDGVFEKTWKSSDYFKYYGGNKNHDIAKNRSEIDDGRRTLKCYYCGGRVGLRGGAERGKGMRILHPYHLPGNDMECIYTDKSMPTKERINAKKFHGLQTGETHESIKNLIKNKLERQYSAHVDEEKRVYIGRNYRQADLLVHFPDKKQVAIEIQISTLWLKIVNERNNHYRSSGRYILWVLDEFSPDRDYQSFTQERILVTNEYNVFVYDLDAKIKTENSLDGELYLHCYYSDFDRKGNELNQMKDEVIPFSALTFRESDHMVFYKSKEQIIDIANEKYKEELLQQQQKNEEELRRKNAEKERHMEKSIKGTKKIFDKLACSRSNEDTDISIDLNITNLLKRKNPLVIRGVTEFFYETLQHDMNEYYQNPRYYYQLSHYDNDSYKRLLQKCVICELIDKELLIEKGLPSQMKEFLEREKQKKSHHNEDGKIKKRLDRIKLFFDVLRVASLTEDYHLPRATPIGVRNAK